jgi:hypothetical protein
MLAHQVGFDHHFVKPCDPREVLSVLEALQQPDPSGSGPGPG